MSNNFNWRTDEDNNWDKEEIKAPARPQTRLPWRRPARIMGFLLLVAGALLLVTRQVQERVDEAATSVAVDVLSSFDLLLRAAESRDKELFVTMLSGRDPGWTEAQKMLLEAGLIFGRQTFHLQLDEAGLAENRPVEENIALSSDFNEAVVTFRAPYESAIGNGLTVPIILEQTQVYRRGNDQRWLLAPPLQEFWGEWDTLAGQRLRVRYPARDEALATRLAADLDSRLAAMCNLPDVLCPVDLRVELRLGEEPGTLLTGLDKETQIASGPSFNLPAPTLLGIPVDEAGYQVLLRGYAGHIVSALLTRYSGYECCDHPLFYQALLDFQLSQLAIQPWPLNSDDYNLLLNTALPASRMFYTWSEPFDPLREGVQWRQVYALVDFVLSSETTAPVAEMQRMLNRNATFSGWLYGLIEFPYYDEYAVNRAWLAFLYEKAALDIVEPPHAFPDETLTLVCQSADGPSGAVFARYDLANIETAQTTTVPGSSVFPLPDGRVVATQSAGAGEVNLFVLDDGAEPIIVELPVDPLRHATFVDRYADDGRIILLHDDRTEQGTIQYSMFDPAACTAASCRAEALPGRTVPAPDGGYALAFVLPADSRDGVVQLLDPTLAPVAELGRGWSGGWFDNDTYYFFNEAAIIRGRVSDGSRQTLLDTAQLQENPLFAADALDGQIFFSSAALNPATRRQMLVSYTSISRSRDRFLSQLLLLDLESGDIEVAPFPLPGAQKEGPLDSYYVLVETHGKWIQLLSYSPLTSSYQGTIQILDWQGRVYNTLTTEGHNNYADLQWSPDGKWLIVLDRGWTRIVAVGSNFQQLLFRGNDDGCFGAYWAPPTEARDGAAGTP